jgi:hypothetical protein
MRSLDDPTDLAALAALRPVVTVMDGEVAHGGVPWMVGRG